MLYLRVAQRVPWIDRKGMRRSPLEEFTFLAADARLVLESEQAQEFTVWEVGLLSGHGPSQSKAQIEVSPDASDVKLFAVGVEDAPDYYARLSPTWCGLLQWFAGHQTERVFLSDTVWDAQKEAWVDLGEATRSGLIKAASLARVSLRTNHLYTAEMSGQDLCALVEHWWPSGLGMLAGMALADGHADVVGSQAQQPVIDVHHLGHLQHYFQTSRSFDNLGMVVISRRAPWNDLPQKLLALGWKLFTGDILETPPVLPLLFRQESPR